MPDRVSNAIMLLWLSLAISAASFLWALTYGFALNAVLMFVVTAGLWAFAIMLLPSRNNLARLAIMGVTVWHVINVVLNLGGLFSLMGLIGVAVVAIAAFACFLLLQSDDWFGSLTSVSLK